MEHWFVLYTAPNKEPEAAELLKRMISHELWSRCEIPKKVKVFRSAGKFHLLEDVMFPGYLFVKTKRPEKLFKELKRARKFPQFITCMNDVIVPVEDKDLCFLKDVCGENLQQVMGITKISLDDENRITMADGVLKHYLNRIVKLNLRKRFAIVEVDLFNRTQTIFFGIRLDKDLAG